MNTLESVRKPPHSKTMGIEIECILHESVGHAAKYKHHRFFYAGGDGSINPRDYSKLGIEFVSQPLPYLALCRELAWLGKKFEWTENNSCGIHIHVSNKWLTPKRAGRIQAAICSLSSSEFSSLFGRGPNDYCSNKLSHQFSRYCAVNTTNANTVEFRMFKSGDAKWAAECLRRVKLLVEYRGNKLNYDTMLELFTAQIDDRPK